MTVQKRKRLHRILFTYYSMNKLVTTTSTTWSGPLSPWQANMATRPCLSSIAFVSNDIYEKAGWGDYSSEVDVCVDVKISA